MDQAIPDSSLECLNLNLTHILNWIFFQIYFSNLIFFIQILSNFKQALDEYIYFAYYSHLLLNKKYLH